MTQYVINIGTIPNDGTGDPLRTAFNEVNLNFDQVFAAGPVLSNVQIANNTILTTNTNGNLILAPNGIGVVQANVNIVPNTSNIRNLGAADRRWSTLYIQYANISGAITVADLTATGDVTVGGNLSVTGNVINIGNIITDAKTIQLANTATSANAANGSGITVGANDAIATLLFNSSANAWTTNVGVSVNGNITGNIVAADGNTSVQINREGLLGAAAGFNYDYAANILYAPTGSFQGFADQGTDAILVGVPGTPLGSNVTVQITSNVDNYSQINQQNISTGNSASADYIITADNGTDSTYYVDLGLAGSNHADPDFFGDTGSANDGYLYVTANDQAGPGNSNVGNLIIGSTNGVIKMFVGNTAQANVIQTVTTSGVITAGNILPGASNTYSLGNSTLWWSNIWVSGNTIYIGGVALGMTAGNVLTVGGNAVLQNDSNTTISTTGNITADYFFGNGSQLTGLNTSSISNGSSNVDIATANGNVTVTANGTYTWSFEDTGTMNFPASPASIFGGLDNDFTINTANSNAATYTFTFSQLGDLTVPVNLNVIENLYAADLVGPGNGNVTVTANTESWLFETDGRLFLPNSGVINASGNSVDIGSEDAISLEANTVVNIYTDTNGAGHQWQFGDAGELTLPASSEIKEVANPGGFPGYAMALSPDPNNAIDADQQLLIYPTGGVDANHLHITSGNLYNTELFLGNDDLYVKLANTGNIVVNTNDNGGNFAQWTFDTTGNINLPTNGSINFNAGGIVQAVDEDFTILVQDADDDGFRLNLNVDDGAGNILSSYQQERDQFELGFPVTGKYWQFNDDGLAVFPGNINGAYGESLNITLPGASGNSTVTLKTVDNTDTLRSNVTVDISNVTISTGTATHNWIFDLSGNLTAPGNIITTEQVEGDVAFFNDVIVNNAGTNAIVFTNSNRELYDTSWDYDENTGAISSTANLSTTGNVSAGYFIGNGSQLTGLPEQYGNANVATFLANYGSNTVSTTGNITAGNFVGSGTNVDIVAGSYDWTFANDGNLLLPGNTFAVKYANGTAVSLGGSYGNADVATFLAAFGSNTISTTGNVTANNFIGNIEITGNISGTSANVELVAGVYEWTFDNTGNLTLPGNSFTVNYANGTAVSLGGGSYGNANVADFLDSLGSNAIVTTGNITGGNLISSATLFANPDLILGNTANVSATKTRIVTDTTFSYIQTGNGTVGSTGNIVFSPYASSTQRVVIDTASGNISATGNIAAANLGNIANINLNGNASQVLYGNGVFAAVASGSYGDANVATFLGTYGSNTISSTGNITTTATANVGTLAVTGNATVAGTGSNLIRRASGLVAADINVTLDDLSANVTSSGSQLAISTSGSWQGTGWTESFVGAGVSVQNWVNLPMNPGYAFASQAMNSQGHGCRCVISDQTPTAKVYQITVVRSGTTGAQWNITIERLV